jgi:hypothetical protein
MTVAEKKDSPAMYLDLQRGQKLQEVKSPKKATPVESDLEESDMLELESFESNSLGQLSSEEEIDHSFPIS